jgi:hypothetical protein
MVHSLAGSRSLSRSFALSLTLGIFGSVFAGCATSAASDDSQDQGSEDGRETSEANLTSSERTAICSKVTKGPAFTAAETTKLLSLILQKASSTKREHERLIAERGVGNRMGNRSEVYQLLEAENDAAGKAFTPAARSARKAKALALLQAKLKPGYRAETVVKDISGTSCIGFVYEVMRSAYAELGRSATWAAVEKCGRAWDSDGLHVQQALIASGWPSPSLPFVTDEANTVGRDEEKAMLREFLSAVKKGSYYGTPVSKSMMLRNFLPMPMSQTETNDAMLVDLGSSNSFGIATFRGAFHVPFIVPAAGISDEFAPAQEPLRSRWLDAKERGEAFMIESHSMRQPWDPTNFELRPLTLALAETYAAPVVYSTGNILLAPNADFTVTP